MLGKASDYWQMYSFTRRCLWKRVILDTTFKFSFNPHNLCIFSYQIPLSRSQNYVILSSELSTLDPAIRAASGREEVDQNAFRAATLKIST
jgi:hypothetical protein